MALAKKAAAPKKAAAKAPAKAPAKAAGAKAPAPATVTLKHLSAGIAEKYDTPKKTADAMLSDAFDMMVKHLKKGERIRISGFGILKVTSRPARMGRNPATGEAIKIKASKKVGFRPAKELKEAI